MTIGELISRENEYCKLRMTMASIIPMDFLEGHEFIPLPSVYEYTNYPKLPDGMDGVLHTAKFTLVYPFSEGLEKTVTFTTVKDIAVAVLNAFEEMYDASQFVGNVPGMLNHHYTGLYGDAYHCIDDLYIEGILFNPEESVLFISLGS